MSWLFLLRFHVIDNVTQSNDHNQIGFRIFKFIAFYNFFSSFFRIQTNVMPRFVDKLIYCNPAHNFTPF